MSRFTFDEFNSRTEPEAVALPSGAASSRFTFDDFNSGKQTQRWLTGANDQGTRNGWDTEFVSKFMSGYQSAMDNGTADKYFLNRNTGIATVNQEGVDDQGQRQVVRAGDVFNNGKKVGNVYDRYGKTAADQLLTPFMLRADEQRHGVTVDQKRQQQEQQIRGAQSRQRFDDSVEDVKDEWGDAWDVAAPAGGVLGGAASGGALGATIGALAGPAGIAAGAGIGAVVGGLAGGIGAWLNRDQLEDQAARFEAQNRMLDQEGSRPAAWANRVTQAGAMATSFMSPFQNLVGGAADVARGELGDRKVGFYEPDASGNAAGLGWEAARLGASFLDMGVQFASPFGRAAFTGTMLSQIGGQVGSLTLSGGRTFDERTGEFDRIFFNEENEFDLWSGAAGVGAIGMDAVSLGIGRGIGSRATQGIRQSARDGSSNVVEQGWRFTLDAAGNVVKARPSLAMVAPSEMTSGLMARATAQLKNQTLKPTPQQLYKAAVDQANNSSLRKAVLVNGFGEANEEAVQAFLEPASHNASASLEDIARSFAGGFVGGAGMTAGARLNAQTLDRRLARQYSRYETLARTAHTDTKSEPQIMSKAEFARLPEAERAVLSSTDAESERGLQEAARKVAEEARTTMVAGDAELEWKANLNHEMVARERTDLNTMAEGTYVISKAVTGVKDHEVAGSLNTIVDLFERRVVTLTEQSKLEGEVGQAHARALKVLTDLLLPRLRQAQEAAYAPESTDADVLAVVNTLNAELRSLFQVDPATPDTLDRARAVSLLFVRNPLDNAGSFQLFLPQVSYSNTIRRADSLLQVTMGPVQGMGADFDGDKVMMATRVVLDDDTMLNLRTGRNLLGAMDGSPVNVASTQFERDEIRMLGMARRSRDSVARKAARATVERLIDHANNMLKDGNGLPFASELVDTYEQELLAGSMDAKKNFLDSLATQYPEEMRELGERTWTSPWGELNTEAREALQAFRFSQAARYGKESLPQSIVSPIRRTSEIGKVRARQSTTFTTSLSWEAMGADIFRKWQALHYTVFNSPELTSAVVDNDTMAEMTQLLEALSSGKVRSDLENLLGKDDITGAVVDQLRALAERGARSEALSPSMARPTMAMLANLMVPDLRNGKMYGRTTLAKFLLNQQLDKREAEARSLGALTESMSAKFASLRSSTEGEAFAEIFGSYTFTDLLGLDGDVFGHITLDQWLLDYSNQSDVMKAETSRQLRLHTSYKKMNREQGRHNLPYLIEDFEGDNAITPFQSVVDAALEAGNNRLTWNAEKRKVGGRIGDKSNQTGLQFREGVTALQRAAQQMFKKALSAEEWRDFLRTRPEMARAFLNTIQENISDEVTFMNTQENQLYIAPWVYEMLTKKPEEAEMDMLRHTLLASFRSLDGDAQGPQFYKLQDRLSQLMYRAAKDDRTVKGKLFHEKLLTAKTVDEFMFFVNTYMRGNEAPFTAWNRDVAQFDLSSSKGGWAQQLPSSKQSEAMQVFNAKAQQFDSDMAAELRMEEADEIVFLQVQEALKSNRPQDEPLVLNLQRALRFASKYQVAMGSEATTRSLTGMLLGLFGHPSDKGVAATMFEVDGVYSSKNSSFRFGVNEEQQLGRETSYSVSEANAEPSLLGRDSAILMDEQGREVFWEQLTPETFAQAWADKKNRPLLRAILVPSTLEHTVDGRLEERAQTEASLADLLQNNSLKELYYGRGEHSQALYLQQVQAIAGDFSVKDYLTKLLGSRLGSRKSTLTSPYEAEAQIRTAKKELAEVLQMASTLARTNAALLETLRVELKATLKKNVSGYRDVTAEQLEVMKNLMAKIVDNDPTLTGPQALEANRQVEQLFAQVDPDLVKRLQLTYRVPAKAQGQSDADWAQEHRARLLGLQRYVNSGNGLESRARGSAAVRRAFQHQTNLDADDMLPPLTPKEWDEVATAIIFNEVTRMVSVTVPNRDNILLSNYELADPSFGYLVDILDPNGPVLRAAAEMDLELDFEGRPNVTVDTLKKRMLDTLLNSKLLGVWDDRTMDQIQQGLSRPNSASAPQGISQGGISPQRETSEGMATARTRMVPPANLAVEITTTAGELYDPKARIPMPDGSLAQANLLDGRFATSVLVTASDGTQVNLLTDGSPKAGVNWEGSADHGMWAITANRVRNSMRQFAEDHGVDLDSLPVQIEFFHPADQPEGAEWANNVYFEGTVLETNGDMFGSLDAAWYFAPGGIDGSASAQALQSAKKNLTAVTHLPYTRTSKILQLEAGWQSDFYAMLERKVDHMMEQDLGRGRRIDPTFRNAVMKKLKMRHMVRGIDADGNTVVLTAEQVIARQRAGTDLGLTNMRLYRLSDPALRTMLGEAGDQGEARVSTDQARLDPASITRWKGEVTPIHTRNLPGLLDMTPRTVFDTSMVNRRTLRRVRLTEGLSDNSRERYERIQQDQIARRQATFEARQQSRNPQMYRDALADTLQIAEQFISSAGGRLLTDLGLKIETLRSSTRMAEAIDQAMLTAMENEMAGKPFSTGFVFSFRVPPNGGTGRFGEIHGLPALQREQSTASSATKDDLVVVQMRESDAVSQTEIEQALSVFVGNQSRILLGSAEMGGDVQIATDYLLRNNYRRMNGSRILFEPVPMEEFNLTTEARLSRLTEVETISVENLSLVVQTSELGIEENNAALLPGARQNRHAVTVDLVPTMSWSNFGVPTGADLEIVRNRLSDEALPDLIKQSEVVAGRALTDAEKAGLQHAMEKAREALNDEGLYNPGLDFAPGDIIPLMNARTKQLILYRHGFEPIKDEGQLKALFKDSNTAIYGPTPLDSATTHFGRIIRFERAGRYGLRAVLASSLEKVMDKNVWENSGFKGTPTMAYDPSHSATGELVPPSGPDGWDLEMAIGLSDSIGKSNFRNLQDNLQDAVAFMGYDFRVDYARALNLDPTAENLMLVTNLLQVIQRNSTMRLSRSVVAQLNQMNKLPQMIESQIALAFGETLQLKDQELTNLLAGALYSTTPESQILRAATTYLLYEHANVNHITAVPGVFNPGSRAGGNQTFKPPLLFLETLMDASLDSPLRKHMVERLQTRIPNPRGAEGIGWELQPDFSVVFHNENPQHTFRGYLQFAEIHTSGDNPELNWMAQSRQSTQAASAQMISAGNLMVDASVVSSKGLKKAASSLERQQQEKRESGVELLRRLNTVPQEEFVSFAPELTFGEIHYRRIGNIIRARFRKELDTKEWTDSERDLYQLRRTEVANFAGVPVEMVDYWVRVSVYAGVDEIPESEGGNPGKVSASQATDLLSLFMKNMRLNQLPLSRVVAPLIHPGDLRALFEAYEKKTSNFKLKNNGVELTSFEDWVKVAVGLAHSMDSQMSRVALHLMDSHLHLYQDLGYLNPNMGSSLWQERAEKLLDPRTKELMISLSPEVSRKLSREKVMAVRQELSDVFGGTLEGLSFHTSGAPTSAIGKYIRKETTWANSKDMPTSTARSMADLLMYGDRFEKESTQMNGALRTILNWRAGMALSNPMLVISAPVEQFVQSSLDDMVNSLSGDSVFSRIPGARGRTAEEARLLRQSLGSAANNKELKSLLFGEFAMEETPSNAGPLEMASYRFAKWAGKLQDPYYKMNGRLITRRYVTAALRAARSANMDLTPEELLDELQTNAHWLKATHPALHQMASNTIREMKNTRDTVLSSALRGIASPLMKSSSLAVSTTATLTYGLPFMFAGYTTNKLTQILGLQAVDQMLALTLHGQQKPWIMNRIRQAVTGEASTADDHFDMSNVLETLDLANGIVRSGVTHSALMAFGMIAGGLGLSGEDEEDRRRRRAAENEGFAYIYDPRDIVNDFRNADAIYLDFLPPFFSELFRVPGHEEAGGDRSLVHMNWILRSVLSPIIGMERFFNTSDPMEIWWGFEDAFNSFPLTNYGAFKENFEVYQELMESAKQEAAVGGPESQPKAFNLLLQGVMNLERMLLEHSFLNMLYIAADKYDRDPWVAVQQDQYGQLVTNKLGVPDRLDALRDFKAEDGTIQQGYLGRSWQDATLAGYAENRATLALLGSLVGGVTGTGSMLRYDMAVKTRSIAKPEPTLDEAEANIWSMYNGLLKPGDPVLEGIYIPFEMRNQLKTKLMDDLKAKFMASGLNEYKADQMMWKVWKGDPTDPSVPALRDVVYSQNAFDAAISYKPTNRYYQLNTTYVKGPDGRMWATGLDRHSVFNLAGINPLQRSIATVNNTESVDGRLNYVDEVRGINTGLRGLERVDDSFAYSDLEEMAAKLAAEASNNTGNNSGSGNGWRNFGSGWRNFGRRSGWRNFGRRGGGGGGGGGSFTRLQAPDRQQVPYANDVQNINMTNPIIRRASIRRERIDSMRGRLREWQ